MNMFLNRINSWGLNYLRISEFALTWIGIVMLSVMLVSNTWNIILRSLFNKGIDWHQEISMMAAMWIYFAAYSLIAKTESFIQISFFVNRMPQSILNFISLCVRLFTIAFYTFLSILVVKIIKVVAIYQTLVLEWPEYIYYIPLLVGTFDIVLTEIFLFVRTICNGTDICLKEDPKF